MGSQIFRLGKNFFRHELVTGSLYVFSGSIFGNFLAFLLNLFLARSLSYGDYAIFASLLSVITLAAIPSGSISTIIVKFAADFFVKGQRNKLKTLYFMFSKPIIGVSFAVILLSFAFSVPLKNYLHIDNIWLVFACGFVIASFYLFALNIAFLQSLMKFKFMAFINIVGSILKLSVGVILVILGYTVFGGLGAIFSMMFGMYLVAFFPLQEIFKKEFSGEVILETKKIFAYAIPAFTTILFLTSFISTDVVLVKHFYDPHLAGFYAGLSLLGRVIYFFTFPIPIVLFPLLIKRHAKGVEFNNLFYLALMLVFLPSIAITAFYFIFPDFVVNLFLGGREYLYISKYLGFFGLFLTVFSLVNVCVNLFLSLNKTKVVVPVILGAVSQIILIYIFHSNFYQIIGVSIFVLVALLVFLLYLFFKNYGSFGELKESLISLNAPAT